MDPTIPIPEHLRVPGFSFTSVEQMWLALTEYHEFHDGTVCRSYGPPEVFGAGPPVGEEIDGKRERIMDQNKALDHALFRIRLIAPRPYRLLHALFRRPGEHGCPAASWEYSGWIEALRYSGYSPTKLDRVSRPTFDVILGDAVNLLFYLHQFRPARRS